MAELVDALVSNTNTSRCTGSSPVLGTNKIFKIPCKHSFARNFLYIHVSIEVKSKDPLPSYYLRLYNYHIFLMYVSLKFLHIQIPP